MSQAGGPRGQSLGIWECVSKEPRDEEVSISFRNETGGVVFHVEHEAAGYFVVGWHYNLLATAP